MTASRLAAVGLATLVTFTGATTISAQPRSAPPTVTGGNGLMYIGTYKGEIQIFEEATEKQVGAIPLKTGIPRSLVPSADRQRFYVLDSSLEKVEVVDIATRATLDQFTLSSGTTKVRVRSMAPDPLNRFVILLTRAATKQRDRWEIGPSTLQVYDFAQKKVTRTLDWPQGEERESADLRFSPDGKLLYFFGDDVLIYETAGFTKVDEWPLSHPQEPGMGRVTFGSIDDLYDQPGYFTGLFTMQDPVQNRRLMGVGRVDLNAKRIDFTPLGPAQPLTFAQAPDRKRGYAIYQDIQRYEFWTFDLEQKRILNRAEFKGRPRLDLRVSSNGKLLYVFVAGATIDIYDAATYKLLRTIQMNADQTTDLFVFPAPAPATSSGAR